MCIRDSCPPATAGAVLLFGGLALLVLPLCVALDAMRMPAAKPVPITVFSGFLGAGKTTLLERCLSNSAGLTIGCVVNDVAALNVDGLVARGASPDADGVVTMSNGCACCTGRDGLVEGIVALQRAAAARGGRWDHIVVEATGIAEPSSLRDALATRLPRAAGAALDSTALIGAVGGMAYFGVRADSVQEDWHASTARLAASAALLCAAFSAVCAVLPADAVKASIETSLFTTWAGYALMVARIGAGFGGGGIYTLAAALESRRHTPVAVGLASTGVVLGQVVLYLVGWLLLLVLGLDDTGPQWRCIFAFGALMALLCAWRYYALSSENIDANRRPRASQQQTYDVLALSLIHI